VAIEEVAQRGDSGPLGHNRRHAELLRGGKTTVRVVSDGVTQTAETVDPLKGQAGPLRDLAGGGGVGFSQQPMRLRRVTRLARRSAADAKEELPQLARERRTDRLVHASVQLETQAA